jgi:hypothetical protein
MAEFIGIEVSDVERVYLALAELPPEMVDRGADAVLAYWHGVLSNPANYAKYRYISRAQAYPNAPYKPGYFSARQWRYVMARIHSGEITPGRSQRTGTLARSWRQIGKGESAFLVNQAPYASYVVGDGEQARQPDLVGWLTGGESVNQPRVVAGAERALAQAVEKAAKDKLRKR